MTYNILTIDINEGVALLTINREKSLNALNKDTFTEIDHAFSENLPSVEGLKGVIITGAGAKAFVAGADITEFSGLDESKAAAQSERGQRIFDKIEQFHVPVIAAVNGFALGGGCELAMSCHLRIASINARFGQPEVNLGILPGYGGTQRLIQYIGKTKAMELLLTADMIGADQALTLGLVNAVVESEELIGTCTKMINKIASKGPIAISETIAAVNAYFDYQKDGFQTEVDAFGRVANTEDFKEGAAAFVEKRKANFMGK